MKILNTSNVNIDWSEGRVKVEAGKKAEVAKELAKAAMKIYPFLVEVIEEEQPKKVAKPKKVVKKAKKVAKKVAPKKAKKVGRPKKSK